MCMAMILEALCESFITRHIYYRSYPNNTRSMSLKSSQKQVKLSLNSGSISTTIYFHE